MAAHDAMLALSLLHNPDAMLLCCNAASSTHARISGPSPFPEPMRGSTNGHTGRSATDGTLARGVHVCFNSQQAGIPTLAQVLNHIHTLCVCVCVCVAHCCMLPGCCTTDAFLAHVPGTRHLYAAQRVDSGPKQVQYPVVVVNPDNEIECGRKVLLDRTPSAKQDPANYFTSTLLCHECIMYAGPVHSIEPVSFNPHCSVIPWLYTCVMG